MLKRILTIRTRDYLAGVLFCRKIERLLTNELPATRWAQALFFEVKLERLHTQQLPGTVEISLGDGRGEAGHAQYLGAYQLNIAYLGIEHIAVRLVEQLPGLGVDRASHCHQREDGQKH